MAKVRTMLILGLLAAVVAGSASLWLFREGGEATGAKRVIYMTAVEYKGSTSSEPFPSAEPPSGGGYALKPPDGTGKWETSTYRWDPGTVIVNQGDEVEMHIWGVNGAQHPAFIDEYVPEFTVTRGKLTVLTFTANKAGTFRIHCNAHQPSMESQLVVLAAKSAAENLTPTPVPAKLPATGAEDPAGGSPNAALFGGLALLAAAAALSMVWLRRSRP
jgi:hypothetical protein